MWLAGQKECRVHRCESGTATEGFFRLSFLSKCRSFPSLPSSKNRDERKGKEDRRKRAEWRLETVAPEHQGAGRRTNTRLLALVSKAPIITVANRHSAISRRHWEPTLAEDSFPWESCFPKQENFSLPFETTARGFSAAPWPVASRGRRSPGATLLFCCVFFSPFFLLFVLGNKKENEIHS